MIIEVKEQYKQAQEELDAINLKFAKGEGFDEDENRAKELELAMDESSFTLDPDSCTVVLK